MIEYRYFTEDGLPLKECPECGEDLAKHGGISIHVSVGDHEFDLVSRLDEGGRLLDIAKLVANGYHAGTYCGGCDELLLHVAIEEELETDG